VLYNGEDITSKCKIVFDDYYTQLAPYALDKYGIFVQKLSKGNHSIRMIYYKDFTLNFPPGTANFEIPENGTLNYIGDLTINWVDHNKVNAPGLIAGNLVGGLIGETICGLVTLGDDDGGAEIYAENNLAEMKNYLQMRYESTQQINDLTPPLSHPEDFANHKLFIDPSENPNYMQFDIKNKESVIGYLRYVKEKKIYVLYEDKIYVIPRKKLIGIKDHNGEVVHMEELFNQEFKTINFNKYDTVIL